MHNFRFLVYSIVILLLTLQSQNTVAQTVNGSDNVIADWDPFAVRYNPDSGFPSLAVWRILEDSKGYIWISSPMGLHRFDGSKYELVSPATPYMSVIYEVEEDSDGMIWLLGMNNAVYQVVNDSISPYKHNDKVLEVLGRTAPVTGFAVDENYLYFGHKHLGLIRVNKEDGGTHLYSQELTASDSMRHHFLAIQLGERMIVGKIRLPQVKRTSTQTYAVHLVENGKLTEYRSMQLPANRGTNTTYIQPTSNNRLVFAFNQILMEFDRDSIYSSQRFEHFAVGMGIGNQNDLWIGTENGVLHYEDATILNSPKHYFKGVSFNLKYPLTSKEGGIWLPSLTHGAYYLSNLKYKAWHQNPTPEENTVFCVHQASDQNLYTGHLDGSIRRHSPNGSITVWTCNTIPDLVSAVYDLHWNEVEQRLWAITKQGIFTIDTTGKVEHVDPSRGRILVGTRDGTVWAVTSGALLEFKDGAIISTTKTNSVITSIIPFKNELYYYQDNQIYCLDENREIRSNLIPKSLPQDNNYDLQFLITQDSTLLIFLHDQAIYEVKPNSVVEKHLNFDVPEGESVFAAFAIKNRLAIVTTSTLQVLDSAGNIERYPNFFRFAGAFSTFFESTDEYCIAPINEFGVAAIPWEDLASLPPNIECRVAQVRVNRKQVELQDHFDLEHNQNRISLAFTCQSSSYPSSILFRYKMEGIDSTWIRTRDTKVEYSSLPPGDYTFKLALQTFDTSWEVAEREIQFTIAPPFWLTTWFIALEILAGLLLSFSIFQFFTHRRWKKRLHQESINKVLVTKDLELIKARMKAIQAQMNPHFLFNCLTAIQGYIVSHPDSNEGSQYLGRFAKLMRQILDLNRADSVPLEDELAFLNNYLSLQQLRFESPFSYEVEVDSSIDLSFTEIPPMLVQPLLENSIEHGLRPLDGEGKLHIKIDQNDTHLLFAVSDNGVGGISSAGSQNGHKSVGIKIIRERLAILNRETEDKISFEIIDYSDNELEPMSTTVRFMIPL